MATGPADAADMSMWDIIGSASTDLFVGPVEDLFEGSEFAGQFGEWWSEGIANAPAQADAMLDIKLFRFEQDRVRDSAEEDGIVSTSWRCAVPSGSTETYSSVDKSAVSGNTFNSHSIADMGGLSNSNGGDMPSCPTRSSGSAGPGSGWQSLLQDLEPPPPAPAKRGRKPPPGGTAKKPVKDKKRDNTILIRQLEAQMASKLNIVSELEGQNTELKRKERLLQLSVNSSEQSMSRLVDPQLTNATTLLLRSFRGAYNRATAEQILSKIGNMADPKEFTFEVFSTCWQALVMEMCDSLMEESTAPTPAAKQASRQQLQILYDRFMDFIPSLKVHHKKYLAQAQNRNLVTGEPMNLDDKFWDTVAEKMDLSQEQIRDLVGAYDMCLISEEHTLRERTIIKGRLSAAITAQAEAIKTGGSEQILLRVDHATNIQQALDQLRANIMRTYTANSLMSYCAMKMYGARAVAKMVMHASPAFPSPHAILVAVKKKAIAEGLVQASAPGVGRQAFPVTSFQTPVQ